MFNRRGRPVFKFLVPYLSMLLLAGLVSVIMYHQTIRVVKEEVSNRNQAVLQLAKQQLDRQIVETSQLAISLSKDPKVLAMQQIVNPYDRSSITRLLELQKQLRNYSVITSSIESYYIHYAKSRFIISSDRHSLLSQASSAEANPESVQTFIDGLEERYYYQEMMPETKLRSANGDRMLIPYIHTIGYPSYYLSHIVMFIDSTSIQAALRSIDLSEGGYAYLANQEGDIIAGFAGNGEFLPRTSHIGNERQLPGQFVTSIELDNGNWRLVAVQPEQVVLRKVYYVKNISAVIILGMLAIGGVASVLFAYRNSRPLKALIQTVFQLESQNERLHRNIDEQKPMLQAAFLQRLLDGAYSGQREMESVMQYMDIPLNGERYSVIIVQLQYILESIDEGALEKLDLEKAGLRECIAELEGDHSCLLDIGENKLALIYTSDAANVNLWKQELTAKLEAIRELFLERFRHAVQFGIGRPYSSLMDVSASFEEASTALSFGMPSSSSMSFYDDLPRHPQSYYYPFDLEQKLLNYLRSGNSEELDNTFDSLFVENFVERSLIVPVLRLLLSELVSTALKFLDQAGWQMFEDESSDIMTLLQLPHAPSEAEACFNRLRKLYHHITERVNDQKRIRNEELMREIVSYLDRHYPDQSLCLPMLSDQFQISETYLSLLVKEHTGCSFSDYVNRKRMDAAKELLSESMLNIEQIADHVGYSSLNSFSRAFKRMHGVTPTRYRALSEQ
ncbi:helix-turn-helix domain-containing protein [Paenibacillus sp. NRS-1760]|uniref:helix-turn-helix domain-containing protein n=1 Tax=Paenibacillus sp. NRS-1760 TaxID=3233902 RepID=UPI003D2E1953